MPDNNNDDQLERRANEFAQQRLALRDQLFDAWENLKDIKTAIRDISVQQRLIDAELKERR